MTPSTQDSFKKKQVTHVSDKHAIAVLGAGSWGTALAVLLARNGFKALLWGHDPEHMARLEKQRENTLFLSGVPFPFFLKRVLDTRAHRGFPDSRRNGYGASREPSV